MKKFYFFTIALFFLGIGTSIAQYTILLTFNGVSAPQGQWPWGSLTISGKKMYGMTSAGGAFTTYGCIFSMDTTGGGYKDIHDFNTPTGGEPQFGTLVLSNGVLYGMAYMGGTFDGGVIFSIDTNGNNYRVMYNFGASAPNPTGSLTLVGKKLYGMTPYGGPSGMGNIFSIDTNATGYTDLFDFNGTNGEYPYGSLTLVRNKLYGGATMGGAHSDGDIFSIDTNGTGFRDLYDLTGATGQYPEWGGQLTLLRGKLYGTACNGGANTYGCIFSIDTNGSGYHDMLDFTGSSAPNYGANPSGSLTQVGSYFFGMTPNNGCCIFSIDTNGTGYSDLYDFLNPNGTKPFGSLTLAGNMFYGMTQQSGPSGNGDGDVFKFKTNLIITAADNAKAMSNSTRLYPNPNNGNFVVSITSTTEKSIIEIFNMLGEKVYAKALDATNTELELGNNASGVYLYRVISETGNLVSEGKFILQK